MKDDVISTTYEQWGHCIEVRCGIPLTQKYVGERSSELQEGDHARTKEFARLYGTDHLQRTIAWFRRAADEVSVETGGRRHA